MLSNSRAGFTQEPLLFKGLLSFTAGLIAAELRCAEVLTSEPWEREVVGQQTWSEEQG